MFINYLRRAVARWLHGTWHQVNCQQRGQHGQTIVEFSLTIVLLLMLIFGMIDLSRMVYTASVVQAAATEGARTGVVDMAEIVPAIHGKMVGLDENRTQIDVSMPDSNRIEVGVSYQFHFLAPVVAQAVNHDGFTLHGSASMITR